MVLFITLLFISIALLIVVSNLIVDIATNVSKEFNISLLVISIIVVGFGSSLPEFMVSITLGQKEEVLLSLGNIIGSNIFNIFIVIGVASVLYPLKNFNIKNFNTYFLIVTTLALVGIVLYQKLSFTIGILLLLTMAVYIIKLISTSKENSKKEQSKNSNTNTSLKFILFSTTFLIFSYFSNNVSNIIVNTLLNISNTTGNTFKYYILPKEIVMAIYSAFIFALSLIIFKISKKKQHTLFYLFSSAIALSLLIVALISTSNLVYISSAELAYMFHVSERIIAFLLLAIGTSVPELSLAISASIKRKSEVVIGNVIGSNIFNILFVLGFLNILKNSQIGTTLLIDSLVVLLSTLVLSFIIIKQKTFTKLLGVIFIVVYIAYLTIFVFN